jgi:two-component system response regulator
MTGAKILLVEDNRDDVLLTIRALEKANIVNHVDVAKDGIEALEYLRGEGKFRDRDTAEQPAIILLDLKMPRMGGLDFLRTIRGEEKFRLLPTVILTSSREEQDIIESYRLGANSYIQKPVDFDQFVKAVQTLGLYWLVFNISPDGGASS